MMRNPYICAAVWFLTILAVIWCGIAFCLALGSAIYPLIRPDVFPPTAPYPIAFFVGLIPLVIVIVMVGGYQALVEWCRRK